MSMAREVSEAHMDACLEAGIMITGTNAEVALGQWEYQCFGKGLKAADDLWVSRYLLHLIAEEYGVSVNIHPKAASRAIGMVLECILIFPTSK